MDKDSMIEALERANAELREKVKQLEEENARLRNEVADLKSKTLEALREEYGLLWVKRGEVMMLSRYEEHRLLELAKIFDP